MSEWYVRDFKQTKGKVTTTWHGLFVKERQCEDSSDIPVMLCRSWAEAHEVLAWMKNNPQEQFERNALAALARKTPKRAFSPRNRLPNGCFAVLDARL